MTHLCSIYRQIEETSIFLNYWFLQQQHNFFQTKLVCIYFISSVPNTNNQILSLYQYDQH